MSTLLRSTWVIFTTHLWTVLRSKRALLCFLLALGPPLLGLAVGTQVDGSEVVWMLGMMLLLQLVAPLIGLIAGSAVVTEEIENRTITFVFTRPVPRTALFLGRYLATLVLVSLLLAPSAVGLVVLANLGDGAAALSDGTLMRLVLATTLAGAMYSLLTAGLGVFVKRPMVVGLFYMIAMEGFLANVPGSAQKATIQYYLRGIFTGLGTSENEFLRDEVEMITKTVFLTPTDSAMRLLVVMAMAVAVCAWGIRRRQFVLTS